MNNTVFERQFVKHKSISIHFQTVKIFNVLTDRNAHTSRLIILTVYDFLQFSI